MGLKKFGKILFPEDENIDEGLYIDDPEEGVEVGGNVRSQENGYAPRGVNISTGGSSIEMKVVTPKSYDSVTQIADLLLAKKTVLMNLENTNRETARRLIDFLSGVAYALGGGVQKVADNTYAITPSNVAVSKGEIGSSSAPEADGASQL